MVSTWISRASRSLTLRRRSIGSIVSRTACASVELQVEVARREVGEAARVLEVGGDHHHLGRDPLAERDGAVEALLDAAHQRLDLEALLGGGGLLDALDLGLQVRLGLADVLDAGARQALDEDADAAVGQLEHPHDDGRGADAVEVGLARVLDRAVALRHQHDDAALGERAVDRQDALVAPHRQRQDDVREDDRVLERQHGQDVGDLDRLVLVARRAVLVIPRVPSSGSSICKTRAACRLSWIFGNSIVSRPSARRAVP